LPSTPTHTQVQHKEGASCASPCCLMCGQKNTFSPNWSPEELRDQLNKLSPSPNYLVTPTRSQGFTPVRKENTFLVIPPTPKTPYRNQVVIISPPTPANTSTTRVSFAKARNRIKAPTTDDDDPEDNIPQEEELEEPKLELSVNTSQPIKPAANRTAGPRITFAPALTPIDSEFSGLDTHGSFFAEDMPSPIKPIPQLKPIITPAPPPPLSKMTYSDYLKSPMRSVEPKSPLRSAQAADDADGLLKQWEERRQQIVQGAVDEQLHQLTDRIERVHVDAAKVHDVLQQRVIERQDKAYKLAVERNEQDQQEIQLMMDNLTKQAKKQMMESSAKLKALTDQKKAEQQKLDEEKKKEEEDFKKIQQEKLRKQQEEEQKKIAEQQKLAAQQQLQQQQQQQQQVPQQVQQPSQPPPQGIPESKQEADDAAQVLFYTTMCS